MKFVLFDDYTYRWPVTVSVPGLDKPGTFTKQEFMGHFRALSADRVKALGAAEDGDELRTIIREGLIGWSGVEGPDGAEIPFSDDALSHALQFSWFRLAVFKAILDVASGRATEKN